MASSLPGLVGWLLWQPIKWPGIGLVRAFRWGVQRPRQALGLLLVVVLALGSAYYLWFRNSSFASVDLIHVEGTTVQVDEINEALATAAQDMTTLNADAGALEDALARFPTVAGVEISADFPHELTVTVIERPPVAAVASGDRVVAVDGDGQVLEGVAAGELSLPTIEVDASPSAKLSGDALTQVQILSAAPPPLRPLVEDVAMETGQLTLVMKGGVELRFGPPQDIERKWAAATAVLADPMLTVAEYVDLRIPARPAVGGDPTNPVSPEEGKPST
jgi:cell division protein FtsQ